MSNDHTLTYYHSKQEANKERGVVFLRDAKLETMRKDPMRLSINDGEIVIKFRSVAEKLQWTNELERQKESALKFPPAPALEQRRKRSSLRDALSCSFDESPVARPGKRLSLNESAALALSPQDVAPEL